MRSDRIIQITKEVSEYGASYQGGPREAVLNLYEALAQAALSERRPATIQRIHEAKVLLTLLCQLAHQGWPFAQGIWSTGEKTHQEILRMLWLGEPAACPSRRRRLEEQQPREYTNALRILSSILARHAQEAWGESTWQDAAIVRPMSPLVARLPGHVDQIRAYGNAITPWLAAQVIRAWMEAANA